MYDLDIKHHNIGSSYSLLKDITTGYISIDINIFDVI